MKRITQLACTLVPALISLLVMQEKVSADTLVAFGQPDFEWSHAAEGWVKPYHIWLADDYWAQTFPATLLPAANHLTLTLFVDDNTFSSQELEVNVLLNDTVIGSLVLSPGMLGVHTFDFSFDPIAGPDYRLEIRAANTVTDTGCVSIAIDGRSFIDLRFDTVLAFSQPDFEWSHAGDNWVKPYHIWITGDYWAQNFLSTLLPAASHLTLQLTIDDNTFSSQQLDVDVLLNEIAVGSFSMPPGMLGPQTLDFSFDPIAGPDFRLEIRATNTVTDTGCVSMAIDGRSFFTLTAPP